MFELTVIVKDAESRYKRDFVIYETCQLHEDDVYIKDCIDTTLKEFDKEPESIQIKIHMEIK